MGSKTLDFTSWYELQADSESDEESSSSHCALPSSHSTYSPYSTGGTRYQPLQQTSDVSASRHTGRASLIQQLLDEMDDANQKIDQFYDGKKPSGGMSLEEFPIGQRTPEMDESGCDEVVSSAIAEVSKDFITGNLSTGPLASGESDESHVSSDNDLRHRRGAAYAKYPETAAGLSDNDWNPYVTESDTNNSPRLTGDLRPPSILASASDSKVNSLVSSFNPPFCSTKTGSASRISKTSLHLMDSRPTADSSLPLSDIKETSALSARSIASFKPDSSISPPQLTSSKLSEYSFGKGSLEPSPSTSLSQSRDEATRNLRKCFERTSWPPESGSSGRASQGSDTGTGRDVGRSQFKADSGIDYTRVEESFKKLVSFEGDADKSWEIKSSLPGRGYFSDAVQRALSSDLPSATNFASDWEKGEMTATKLGVNPTGAASHQTKGFSLERFSGDARSSKDGNALEKTGLTRISRDSDSRTSATSSSTETVIPASAVSRKDPSLKHTDYLTVQVDKLLQETAYLTSSSRAKEREKKKELKTAETSSTSLDYDRLHRDLQEIQESLHTMGQPPVDSPRPTAMSTTGSLQPPANTASTKSDSDDAEIVPSTTTTPERGRRLMWDYAGDLGYGQEGMMSDVTAESSPLDPLHPNNNKNQYTSDGEETRTSSLDHGGEEEEHHEDMTLTLANQMGEAVATARNGVDYDDLISTFRSESRALETRYQAVQSQGMADKVLTILTSSNPDQQAQGILSQVSAQERDSLHRASSQALGDQLDGSYDSSPSSTLKASQSEDPVRKRLDLSSLSDSADSSQLLPSFFQSQPKLEAAFSATNFAQTLISEQMKKMADRTFNHSIELRTPVRQEVQCYPVYSSQRDQPQYQQLQAQLQQQLQQQQQQRREQAATKAAETKEKGAEAAKSPRGESAEKKLESLSLEESQKVTGSGDDSPGAGTSPADSDKSSELRRGKYRPYRPAGSQDVYYTESDTASVAESVTTVESTHTGSDDAVGPYFPSAILGSRQDPAGQDSGIYSKRGKPVGPAGSSVDPPLPTIEERATPDPRDPSSSDSSSRAGAGHGEGARTGPPMSASGATGSGTQSSVSDVMARRQARVEDILRERDSVRKLPSSELGQEEGQEKSRGEEMLEAYRAQKADPLRAGTSSPQPSRIPVRGPPPDYSTALRSKREEEEQRMGVALAGDGGDRCTHNVSVPSFADRQARSHTDKADDNPDDSTETRLLKAIDAQVETEILEKQTGSSSDQNDNATSTNPRQQKPGSKDSRASAVGRTEDRGRANPGRGESSRPTETERERRWREAEVMVQRAQGGLEVDDAQADKRQEEVALLQQRRQEAGREGAIFSQHAQGRLEVDRGLEERLREEAELDRQRLKELQHTIASPRSAARIAAGEKDVDEASADKRREEAELERRSLEVQILREREIMQATELVREQERQEALRRTERLMAEAEARRAASLELEDTLRRERELITARREAELRAGRELDAGQDQHRQQADQQQEDRLRREAELLRGIDQQKEAELRRLLDQQRKAELQENAESRRIADARLAAEMEEEAEQRRRMDAAAASEEALRREVQRTRDLSHQRKDPRWEAQRQREAEEAIARAGGGQQPVSEADQEMLRRGHELLRERETQEALDRQPLSHRAQLLREALESEPAYQGRPDLQFLWERFLAGSTVGGQEQDSSLNSERLNELADLMRDPTQHLVHTFLSQRQAQHRQDKQRAQATRDAVRQREQEERRLMEEERAVVERELKRQEARQQSQRQSSEEESNGSYGEIIQQRERDRLRRREVRNQRKKQGKTPSPSKPQTSKHTSPSPAKAGDAVEMLYSIPEDTNQNMSPPPKSRSPHRSPSHHHSYLQQRSDVIDPNMVKLRERISKQRQKIGQERVKELRREQKLQKLKALLQAKRTGLMDDTDVAAHMATISSTSAASSEDSVAALSQITLIASELSDNTTTAKDSSTEMRKTKFDRSPAGRMRPRAGFRDDASMDTDEFLQLLEDSGSQTESDYSVKIGRRCQGIRESPGQTRKRVSPSSHPSKHGGKYLKLHQMYSPYKRGEYLQPTKQSRHSAALYDRADSRTRDFGAMYPSPKQPRYSHPPRHKGGSRLISQGVQTSPHRTRSPSPPHEDRPALPVPLMNRSHRTPTKGRQAFSPQGRTAAAAHRAIRGGKLQRPSRSISPAFDSSQVAACLSPDRDRPRSASPAASDRRRRRSPSPTHHRSPSPVELRLKAWTEREARSPLRDSRFKNTKHGKTSSPHEKSTRYDSFDVENRPPTRHHQRRKAPVPAAPAPPGLSWFIPLKEDKPWQQPLKERQAFAATLEDWRPMGLSKKQWRELARADLEEPEGGLRGSMEGEAARMYLHRATKEAERELGQQYDKFEEKPLCRMSLQEALMNRRPDFISKMRQRQKRLKLAAEDRQLQALVRAEQERLFLDQRRASANPGAHPYSGTLEKLEKALKDNLHQPKRRVFSKQEMKEITEKKYKRLPEVQARENEQKRSEEYKLNRLRAKIFNKRVQRRVLERGVIRCR